MTTMSIMVVMVLAIALLIMRMMMFMLVLTVMLMVKLVDEITATKHENQRIHLYCFRQYSLSSIVYVAHIDAAGFILLISLPFCQKHNYIY